MTGVARSALNPEAQSLALPVLMAVLFHVIAASTLACAAWLLEPAPKKFIDDHAMEVSMMVLPKSKTRMAERAQHAPKPTGETPTAVEEAPIRESDLTINTPEAKPTKGTTKDTSKDREKAMRELLMQQMIDDDSPEGAVDRTASDPNSESDVAINATGVGVRTDPEYARYVSQVEALFKKNFHPLPTIVSANPGIKCRIHIQVDPATGNIVGHDVILSSDNASYDRSAESAVQAVTQIPLPPERFRDLLAEGYTITFEP